MAIFSNNSQSDQKLDQTALILEHLEMLLALHEEQGQQNPDDLDQLLNKTVDQISISLESQLGDRFEKLETQIQKLSGLIKEQNLAIESITKSTSPGTSGEPSTEHRIDFEDSMNQMTGQFGEQTNLIAVSFNAKIEKMFEDLGSRVAQISAGITQQESTATQLQLEQSSKVEPLLDTSADSASHWHRQKEAMLSKYGIDPDYRPVMELDSSTDQNSESDSENETAENIVSESMSETDADEIKKIKDMLNEKLREAEVELSINRAKLSQQQAEMESAQVELDRRATAIEEKYAAVMKQPKRRVGFLERLTRHLGHKKPE